MQNLIVAFLAGMAVMYLLNAIRWRKTRRWVRKRWETYQAEFRRRNRRRKKHG